MKGHPILGAISGFFFGLFLGATLFLYGVVSLDSNLLVILPVAGVVVGLVLAWLAPFGHRGQKSPPSPSAEGSADSEDSPAGSSPEPGDEPQTTIEEPDSAAEADPGP